MGYPGKKDVDRLTRLGWKHQGMLIPAEVRRIIVEESAYQHTSMSVLVWSFIAAVWLKAHDAAGRSVKEVREEIARDPERAREGHKRIWRVLQMAHAERQRVYEEVEEERRKEREREREQEADMAKVARDPMEEPGDDASEFELEP